MMAGSGPVVGKAYVTVIPTTKGARKEIAAGLIPAAEAAGDEAGAAGGSGLLGGLSGALSGGVSKVATAAKGIAGVGIDALTGVTSAAYAAFSDWEQLSGGVEAIFGRTSETASAAVIANAKNAFKTVQMSTNDYLDTVTSFSASLIQSLGGDADAAASVADKAITDMADNANRMGTSLDSLRYAYQGFARGQFTMLDNLKLGYGGTASEMARLINDSGVLGDEMIDLSDKTNLGAKLQEVGFAKMIEAIHVVQENLGITGTAAEEAAHTLEGSMNMTKAAWENMLLAFGTGSADEIMSAAQNLVDSAVALMSNALPRIGAILAGIVQSIPQMVAQAASRFPEIATQMAQAFIESMSGVGLGEKIAQATNSEFAQHIAPQMEQLGERMSGLMSAGMEKAAELVEYFKPILEIARENVMRLAMAFADHLFSAINMILDLISKLEQAFSPIIESIQGQVLVVIDNATDLFSTLGDIGSRALGTLVGAVSSLVDSLAHSGIKETFDDILGTIVGAEGVADNALGMLADLTLPLVAEAASGIGDIAGKVAEKIGEFIQALDLPKVGDFLGLIQQIKGAFGKVAEEAGKVIDGVLAEIGRIIESIDLEAFGTLIKNVGDALSEVFSPNSLAVLGMQAIALASELLYDALGLIGDIVGDVSQALTDLSTNADVWKLAGAFEKIRDALSLVLDLGKRIISEVFEVLRKDIWPFVEGVARSVLDTIERIVSSIDLTPIMDLFGRVREAFQNVFEGDSESGPASALEWAKNTLDDVLRIIGDIGEFASDTIGKIADGISESGLEATLQVVKDVLSGIWDIGTKIVDTVITVFENEFMPYFEGMITLFVDHIWPWLQEAWVAIQPAISTIISFVVDLVSHVLDLVQAISEFLKPIIEEIFEFLGPVFDQIGAWIVDIANGISEKVQWVYDTIKPPVDEFFKALGDLFGKLKQWVEDHKEQIDAVLEFIGGIIQQAIAFIAPIVKGVIDGIGKEFDGIVNTVKGVFELVTGIISGDMSKVKEGIDNIIGGIIQTFSGFADAISAPFKAAFDAIRKLWNDSIGGFGFEIPDWVPIVGGGEFKIPKLADGGDLTLGGTVIVGEQGPELLDLPRGARVRPLDSDIAETGDTYNVNVGDVNLSDDAEVKRVTKEYLEYLASRASATSPQRA